MKSSVKKASAAALIFVLILSAACGNNSDNDVTSDTSVTSDISVISDTSVTPDASEPYKNRYPGERADADYSAIKILDNDGNDISEIAIDLWYCMNDAYDEDAGILFTYAGTAGEDYYTEMPNFDNEISNIFTENAKAQLENTERLIKKENGKVYRVGPWRTNYRYSHALIGMKVKEASPDKLIITAEYQGKGDYIMEETSPEELDFTIVKSDGKWLVDDFDSPAY